MSSIEERVELELRHYSNNVGSDLKLVKKERSSRALLLLLAACLGDYSLARLEPIGVALELLNTGVKKHFGANDGGNLDLIAADHYYARALDIVVSLSDNRIVRRLSDALSEVSVGQVLRPPDRPTKPSQLARQVTSGAFAEYYRGLTKRCAFYRAAAEIGAWSVGLPETLCLILAEYGTKFGLACEARHERYVPSVELAGLIRSAHNALTSLPNPAANDSFREVTNAVVFTQ